MVEFAGTQDPACKRTGLPEHGPREAAKARRDAVETRDAREPARARAQEAATPRRSKGTRKKKDTYKPTDEAEERRRVREPAVQERGVTREHRQA